MDYQKTFYRLEYVRETVKWVLLVNGRGIQVWMTEIIFLIINVIILIGENPENKDKYREESNMGKCMQEC